MKYFVVGLMLLSLAANASSPLILQPQISPDGKHIAFSYQGDIWTVNSEGGRADRLTIHEGYEGHPAWSFDSQNIAFSSDRFGNHDVFIMPLKGGTPTRLSYHSASDRVTGFTPDGNVLFNTRRIYAQVEREWEIFSVEGRGSKTESRFMDALGFDAVVSPDGNKVAFVRGTCRISREAYRGPANRDIWIYDRNNDSYSQLTMFDGNDFMPKWVDNDTLHFISSRSGKYNVHQVSLEGREQGRAKLGVLAGTQIQQITNEKEFGIFHFSNSKNGEKLVYQTADKVVSHDLLNDVRKVVDINVNADFRFDPKVSKTISNKVDEYAVSPNGKLSAYVLRGDIYVSRNDKDDKRSVAISTGQARDRDITWLNDEALIFVSDKQGQNDLFLVRSDDPSEPNLFKTLKHNITRITDSPEEEFEPVIAPNGKHIVFRQDRGVLISATISASGKLSQGKTLLDGWDIPSDVSWSPDSKWLAYSLSDLNFNEEVYIHAADNSRKPVNVSMHPRYDSSPMWSPDGSKLGFISMRNNGDFDIWFAWLNKEDWQRSTEEWRRLDKEENTSKPAKKPDDAEQTDEAKNSDAKSDKPVIVNIDFEGIYKRLTQVTAFSGNETEFVFDKDGEHIYYTVGGPGRQNFTMDRDLYKIKWDGKDKKHVLKGNKEPENLSLEKSGKFVYTLDKDGKITRISTKSNRPELLNVSSRVNIDYLGEREQMFDEGWRALNAGFYDPEFHGQDWQALRKKYRPLALKASTKEDFQYIFNLMLGQLNASHMGMSRGDNQKQTQSQKTGLLGIEGMHTDNGFEISSVLNNSPAKRVDSELFKGDIITAIDRQSVNNKNIYSLLNDTINNPVLLEVIREQSPIEVVIWPTNSLSDQRYDAWVEERRRLTDKHSNGKLGYLHIRGMNWTSFERFERELMAAGYGKEGIVIDVRYNGGGWTTDYLMAVLNVKQHSYTIPRGATKNVEKNHARFKDAYPFSERLPLSAWTKPSIAMSNENSYSNAEIFSHAYKALGLGKLVGRPTFGAVISTGSYGLVDGTRVRMPFRGWWVKETGDNMEKVPAIPDIEVFNPPAYKARGIDPQLKRAVAELLKEL